jgi:hypothetical protein
MRLALADLLCQSCGGYVHPFFDRCPACGAPRPSHLEELLEGSDLGAAAMAADPAVTKAAADSIRRTTTLLALRGMGSRAGLQAEPDEDESVDAAQMIDFVGGKMTYRVFGVLEDPATPIGAGIHVAAGALVLNATHGGGTLASVAAATILGAFPGSSKTRGALPWDGTWIEGARIPTRPGVPRGDLLVIHATDRVAAAFSIANPSGIFGTRARVDHYEELARWIGLLAIVHAEARWQEIGVAPYAAELGLVSAVRLDVTSGRADATRREDGTPPAVREPASTARQAMLELEELRAAGLITQQEYDIKRREILQRL